MQVPPVQPRTLSSRPAVVDVGAAPVIGPRLDSEGAKPVSGNVDAKVTCAVLMLRIEPTADDSLAAIRERSKFGMAIAAMIRMIATTISSSISEKPFCLRMFS